MLRVSWLPLSLESPINDDEEDSDGDATSRGKDIFAPIDFDEDGVQETKGVSSVDAVAFIDDTAPQKEDDLPLIFRECAKF